MKNSEKIIINKNNEIKKIAILTSGGDSPGMNAAVYAATKTALSNGLEVAFIRDGFKGLVENIIIENITTENIDDILSLGGTILGTARYLAMKRDETIVIAANNLKRHDINALIVIGGDGSFHGAQKLYKHGINFIGIPGTIDNDIFHTKRTIGFDTCCNTIIEAIDKIKTTAKSHNRCFIIEVMGRNCGDLAIATGTVSGADMILIPEKSWNLSEIINCVKRKNEKKPSYCIIVATEMQVNIFELATKIEEFTGVVTRATQLGFIQRGSKPSFFDRYLAFLMGNKSIKLLLKGYTGCYLGYDRGKIIMNSISNKISATRHNNFLKFYDLNKELNSYKKNK